MRDGMPALFTSAMSLAHRDWVAAVWGPIDRARVHCYQQKSLKEKTLRLFLCLYRLGRT